MLPELHGAALEQALDLVEEQYRNAHPPTQQVAIAARILTRLLDEPTPPWRRIAAALHRILQECSENRPQLLGALRTLAPVFLRLGDDIAQAVAETVLTVCSWWREPPEQIAERATVSVPA